MQAKQEGKELVLRNDYKCYTIADVPPIADYKVVLPKGQFNGWHCVRMPAAVGRARINSRGHGCHSLNPRRSHAILKTKSV